MATIFQSPEPAQGAVVTPAVINLNQDISTYVSNYWGTLGQEIIPSVRTYKEVFDLFTPLSREKICILVQNFSETEKRLNKRINVKITGWFPFTAENEAFLSSNVVSGHVFVLRKSEFDLLFLRSNGLPSSTYKFLVPRFGRILGLLPNSSIDDKNYLFFSRGSTINFPDDITGGEGNNAGFKLP